jgi:RNA polymerase sigma-70 factor (ECF subfamily)
MTGCVVWVQMGWTQLDVTRSPRGPDGRTGPLGPMDFDAFAGRERAALVAFAWSLTGDGAVAEDLVQDALEQAWRNWERVARYEKPGAWARRVIANRATDRHRRSGRERRALRRLTGLAGPPPEIELAPPVGLFWEAVRGLPRRQAQVVALHYLEDRSVLDIAEVLGISEGAVKSHLHRGRVALARELGLLKEASR